MNCIGHDNSGRSEIYIDTSGKDKLEDKNVGKVTILLQGHLGSEFYASNW